MNIIKVSILIELLYLYYNNQKPKYIKAIILIKK